MVFGCPVTVTNTGAVVHTVDALALQVRCPDGSNLRLPMFVEYDTLPAESIVVATGFAVAPRASAARIVGFISEKPTRVVEGLYECELTACEDSQVQARAVGTRFNIAVTSAGLAMIGKTGWFANPRVYFETAAPPPLLTQPDR